VSLRSGTEGQLAGHRVVPQTLGLKRGTYYAWSGRPTCRRQRDEQVLVLAIKAAFEEGRGTYGSPRVHAALVADGHRVGLNRVSRLMRENGLRVRPRRAFRCTTTQRDPAHAVAPNVLARDFTADAQGEKWVTDVTYGTPGIRGEQDARTGSRVCLECR